MGGGTSLSSHRAGFGVFWSKAISKSTAESAFADSANCSDYESCHCEVPEARQHIGLWSNALCHCERPKGASQSHSHGDQRNDDAITTQTASARNDSASCHCEERSDVAIARLVKSNDNAITTSNATHSPRNDNTVKRSVAIAKPIKCDSKRKKAAFTLAEVLITLAIIGIVAALTIPTLVQNYQTKAWNTASQVFQRKLGEALKVMNVQGTLAGYTTTEAFVDELSKHIKITRICENDDITTCFADKVTWDGEEVEMSKIKTSKNFGKDDWDTNTVAVQFANGVNGVIAYNPSCTQDPYNNNKITIGKESIGVNDCLAILYDVDGFKNPNTQQKDLRGLNVTSLGGSNCAIELSDGTCFTAPFIPTPLTHAECIERQSEFGITDCRDGDDDYWGGAVKACKDMGSSLPSDTEVMKLAEELYQDANGSFSGNRDNDLAIEWKFITSASAGFWLWSSEEYSTTYAYYRNFRSTDINRYKTTRSTRGNLAVCLAE